MYSANRSNSTRSLYPYVDEFDYESLVESAQKEMIYSTILRLARENSNPDNIRSCGPQKIVKDVGVQTDPEIDDVFIPWLLEAERRTEDFYVQLSNLVNTLYHSQSRALKTKSRVSPPSGTAIIKPQSERHRSNICSKNFEDTKCDEGDEILNDVAAFQLIEDRINSLRQGALELRRRIPKIGLKRSDKTEEQEYEIVEYKTVKETNVLMQSKHAQDLMHKTTSIPPQFYKSKRSNAQSTVSVEKSKVRAVPKHLSHGVDKHDGAYSVPKTKSSVSAKHAAPVAFPHSKNANAKQTSPSQSSNVLLSTKELEVPTKDTGAIPKTKRNTTIRTQKVSKTNLKPMWR